MSRMVKGVLWQDFTTMKRDFLIKQWCIMEVFELSAVWNCVAIRSSSTLWKNSTIKNHIINIVHIIYFEPLLYDHCTATLADKPISTWLLIDCKYIFFIYLCQHHIVTLRTSKCFTIDGRSHNRPCVQGRNPNKINTINCIMLEQDERKVQKKRATIFNYICFEGTFSLFLSGGGWHLTI